MSNILKRVKFILVRPRNFFRDIKNEKGIKSAFIYYVVLLFVVFIVQTILLIISSGSLSLKADSPFPFLTGQFISVSFISIIGGFILFLLSPFIVAGILHLWIKLWKGKGDYGKTYQLFVYARTPSILLQLIPVLIPFLDLIGRFYGLVIFVIGSQEIHGYSKKKSLLVLAFPAVLIVVFQYLFLIISTFILGSMLQGGFK